MRTRDHPVSARGGGGASVEPETDQTDPILGARLKDFRWSYLRSLGVGAVGVALVAVFIVLAWGWATGGIYWVGGLFGVLLLAIGLLLLWMCQDGLSKKAFSIYEHGFVARVGKRDVAALYSAVSAVERKRLIYLRFGLIPYRWEHIDDIVLRDGRIIALGGRVSRSWIASGLVASNVARVRLNRAEHGRAAARDHAIQQHGDGRQRQ